LRWIEAAGDMGRKVRSPLRTCVGCRKVFGKEHLIRIVSSPQGELVPDLKANLPGRGAYLCSRSECVRKAMKRNVLAHAFKRPVRPEQLQCLEERIRTALERSIFSFLGVLMKGNKIVTGRESIRKKLERGVIHLLLTASDASGLHSGIPEEVTVRSYGTSRRLGESIGKAPQPVLGILGPDAVRKLLRLIDQVEGLEPERGEETLWLR